MKDIDKEFLVVCLIVLVLVPVSAFASPDMQAQLIEIIKLIMVGLIGYIKQK